MTSKSLLTSLVLSAGMAMTAPAFAIPLSTVGAVDTLLGRTTLNSSGSGTEVAWIESVLNVAIDDLSYSQTDVTAQDWLAVDNNPGVFALNLASPSDWFLVKIGNNSGSAYTHFLFDNIGSLNYGVVNLTAMGFDSRNTLNIGRISHIGTTPGTSVPEPSSLALLGLGLMGVGAFGRRRVSKQ